MSAPAMLHGLEIKRVQCVRIKTVEHESAHIEDEQHCQQRNASYPSVWRGDYREATHPSVGREATYSSVGGGRVGGTAYPSGGGKADDNIHSNDIRMAKRC